MQEQFNTEFELVKDLNAKLCPYRRNSKKSSENITGQRFDQNLPVVKDKLNYLDFGSEELTKNRKKILTNQNFLSQFNSVMRTCYLKDTIFNGKKELFANTTNEEKLSSGGNGSVAVYYDKETGVPIASGKFVLDYGFNYNSLYFNNKLNFNVIHETLIGLELVNKAKYFLPNYPSTFGLGYCDVDIANGIKKTCRISNSNITDVPVNFIEYLENSITLKSFLQGKYFNEDLQSRLKRIYLQIFNALNILHIINGCYTHYDLHCNNVLLRKLDGDVLIPIYIFEKDILINIKFLKTNYVAYIIDYGTNTYFSYENLLKEFYNKSTTYYGLTTDQIKSRFIFGNRMYKKIFDYKSENHPYDIYKLLGFSYYTVIHARLYSNVLKNSILLFMSHLLKILYNEDDKEIDNFKNNIEDRFDNYFALPNNFRFNKTYSDFVHIISETINDNILVSEKKILSNPKLKEILYSTCLDNQCLHDSTIINKKLQEIMNGEKIENENYIPLVEDINNILIQRRESISTMIQQLSMNKNEYNTPLQKNKSVKIDARLINSEGDVIGNYSFEIPALISGHFLFFRILNNREISKIVKDYDILVYMNRDIKKQVYNNDTILDLSRESEMDLIIPDPNTKIIIKVYDEVDEDEVEDEDEDDIHFPFKNIGTFDITFPFKLSNGDKIIKLLQNDPNIIKLIGHSSFNLLYRQYANEFLYQIREDLAINLKDVEYIELTKLNSNYNIKVEFLEEDDVVGDPVLNFPFENLPGKKLLEFIRKKEQAKDILGNTDFYLSYLDYEGEVVDIVDEIVDLSKVDYFFAFLK